MKKRLIFLLVFFCSLFFDKVEISAQEEELVIEQVQANMPLVTAYVRNDEEIVNADLEAWLGEEKLSVESVSRFSQKGQAMDYFILVDVSNSMPDAYCVAIKDTLCNFSRELGENDKMVLIAFGEEVTVLLSGEENEEERLQAIGQLDNKDNKTLLFEAIQKTADMADKMQDDARKVVLVISDGENFASGKSTSEEAKTALGDRNMPVYAMGISDTAKENLNQFGEIARTLGGTLTVFKAKETESAFKALQDEWKKTWVIEFTASSNKVSNRKDTFSIKQLSSGILRIREVMVNRYQSDSENPRIISVEKTGDKKLVVSFSEPINGGENNAAWNIKCDETVLPVITAVVIEKTKVELHFEKELYKGNYSVDAPGVYDCSMEQNRSKDVFSAELDGTVIEVEKEEEISKWKELLQTWWWVIVVLLLTIVLLVILMIWRKIKKGRGVVYVNGKVTLVDNVSQRHHITLETVEGLPVSIELLGNVEGQNVVHTKICGSMIVGRSEICDLSLNDPKLSRQHFSLELDGSNLLITDLETTNGTKVNNKLIEKDYQLHPGDIISVGDIRLKINW